MAAEGSRSLVRLNAIDRRGRKIEPAVLAAAEGIYTKALEHGVKLLRDPAVVTTVLEEVAATVSSRFAKTIGRPDGPIQIRDLRAYLFEAFLRHVNELKRKELKLVSLNEVSFSNPAWADPLRQFDDKILLDECLCRCDPVAQDMALRRMQGFSWEEIGALYGLSAHAAEARFSYALHQARERLKI
jgi:DNA-directed RNA polymerase specialized sigma24 family protein